MQEHLDEKISLLIDDELDSKQALSLLGAIRNDDELNAKLQRYQIISQALKNQECHLLDSRFADEVRQQISREPIFFIPSKKSKINWRKTSLAVAASVVLAAVWIVNRIDKQSNPYPEPQIAFTEPGAVPSPPVHADAMIARFGDYLQAHDNDVYVSNTLRVQPNSRVVGYQQE